MEEDVNKISGVTMCTMENSVEDIKTIKLYKEVLETIM